MRRITIILATALATLAAATGGAHAAAAKSCGWRVDAHLPWGERCLAAGEFCVVGSHAYGKYGFICPPTRHLRRR
jgi:hypothetical protein